MRTIILAAVLVLSTLLSIGQSFAATHQMGNQSRDELRVACERAGGSFSANLEKHTCTKACTVNGKAGVCVVYCTSAGACTGFTPGRLVTPPRRIEDVLPGSGGGSTGGGVLAQ